MIMTGYYAESNYENAVLQLFTQNLGYSYVYGPDIERDYHSPLYEDELLPALQTINPNLPMAALDDAVYVGDIQGDYDASMDAGVKFIHAAYGFGTIEDKVPEIHKFCELENVADQVLQ